MREISVVGATDVSLWVVCLFVCFKWTKLCTVPQLNDSGKLEAFTLGLLRSPVPRACIIFWERGDYKGCGGQSPGWQ